MPLPYTTSVAHAAAIAGTSRASFIARYVDTGLVNLYVLGEGRGSRAKVLLHELAQALGKEITPDLWWQADRKLDRSRQYQQQYRNRRAGTAGTTARVSPGVRTP